MLSCVLSRRYYFTTTASLEIQLLYNRIAALIALQSLFEFLETFCSVLHVATIPQKIKRERRFRIGTGKTKKIIEYKSVPSVDDERAREFATYPCFHVRFVSLVSPATTKNNK